MFKKGKKEEIEPIKLEEQWVWIDGYKGTDKHMMCNKYQYELGVQHDMPEDAKIEMCESGFHLCMELKDVFSFYDIGDGNRFFKVRALVRASDLANYGGIGLDQSLYVIHRNYNKIVAKSIIFEYECDVDEIFEAYKAAGNYCDYTPKEKQAALKHGIPYVRLLRKTYRLVECGYSEELAMHIVHINKDDLAYALGTQPELSMDTRIRCIFMSGSQDESKMIFSKNFVMPVQ